MMAWQQNLQQQAPQLRGRLLLNEPMTRYTSWAVGGVADVVYRPADVDDLSQFMKLLPEDVAVHWVGLGSNLLVRDAGVRGVVVLLKGAMQALEINDGIVTAGAGVTCARLARQVAEWGYGESAFFAGIPGTLGGSLAMNAGAHGGETWQQVSEVQVMYRNGDTAWLTPEQWTVGYRSVEPVSNTPSWFIAARLRFAVGDSAEGIKAIRELQAHRAATQPIDQRSCGSVFRNPQGDHSARLIEVSGLKGLRMGGAQVSEKHANFIVNADKASAADIEALINHVRTTVADKHGVLLHPEVRIIGEQLSSAEVPS